MRQLKKKIFALMGACIIMSGITAYAEDFYNPVYSDPFNNDLFEIVSEVKFSDEIKKECPDIMGGGTADAGFTVFRYSIVPNPKNEQGYGMKYTNIKIDYDGNAYITSREKLNNTTAYKNGETVTLDVPAKIINGRTLVPVRFIADCFGVEVNWDGVMQRVSLTSK